MPKRFCVTGTCIPEKNYMVDYSNQTRYLNITSKKDKDLQKLIEFIKNNKITIEQEDLSKYKRL